MKGNNIFIICESLLIIVILTSAQITYNIESRDLDSEQLTNKIDTGGLNSGQLTNKIESGDGAPLCYGSCTLLYYEGHDDYHPASDHVAVIDSIYAEGVTTTTSTGLLSDSLLQGFDVLYINEPQISFTSTEQSAVYNFVINGGGLFIAHDFNTAISNTLLAPFGSSINSYSGPPGAIPGVDLPITNLEPHPITSGLNLFYWNYGNSLNIVSANWTILAKYNNATLLAVREAGAGRIAVIGDNDLFADSFDVPTENVELYTNIVLWLCGGSCEPPVADAGDDQIVNEGDVVQFDGNNSKGSTSGAEQVWTKYAGNPVFDIGPSGSWDDAYVTHPSVLYDGATYHMWYSGYDSSNWRIGYAHSSDGITWIKKPSNPIIDVGASGSWEDTHVTHPIVLYDGTKYHMWYSGHDGWTYRIGYASSSDGIAWVKYSGNPVLDCGPSGSWEDTHVTHPTVLYDGTKYRMWYSGHDGSHYRIGYAYSSDGTTWFKSAANPVFNLGSSGSWDDFHVYGPSIIYDGITYYMWYSGHDGSNWRIGYATSSDGITWTKDVSNPLLDIGPSGSWEDVGIHSPTVLFSGGSYHMWYRGFSGTNVRIGYAYSSAGGEAQIVSYEWDFDSNVDSDGDGNSTNDVDATGPTPTHIYGDDGVFNVTLRVTDDQNLTDTDTCNITVFNVAPIIDQTQEYTINEFESVTLIGHATDPGSDDLTFTWNWGYVSWGDKTTTYYNDGLSPDPYPSPTVNPRNITEEATCQYGDHGVFTVTLTVSDDDGGSTIVTTNVTVNNIAPTATIESAIMNVEISLRVAGSKWSNVGLTLYEKDTAVGYLEVERWPGNPNDNPTYENPALPTILDMTKSYKAIVTYDPYPDNNDEIKGDQPNNGKDKNNNAGNPVWIIMKFSDGSEEKIHHTFNTQQSKKRNSKHWNHVEPWEVDLNAYLIGCQFEVTSHVADPGSDDITLTYTYGSQIVNVTYLNNPPDPDPYPSPEVNPRDINDTISLTYEGLGPLELTVIDDDDGTAVVGISLN